MLQRWLRPFDLDAALVQRVERDMALGFCEWAELWTVTIAMDSVRLTRTVQGSLTLLNGFLRPARARRRVGNVCGSL